MATNDLLYTPGTQLTLEDSGGSITATSFVKADDDTVAVADDANYPFLQFLAVLTFGSTPTAGLPVNLYQRRINVVASNNAPVPDGAYPHELIGTFIIDALTSAQYLTLDGVPRPMNQEAEYYLENLADQTISAGWDLFCTPYTFIPAA